VTATLSPAEDLARALARFLGSAAPSSDPWAKYPPVLGVEHVAEILGVQPDSVRADVRRGKLPMRKLAGKYRIDQVAFRALLSSGRIAS